MPSAHEEEMFRIVTRFYAACATPTRRFRRALCAVSLVLAVALLAAGLALLDPIEQPMSVLATFGIAVGLLILALRLALNDFRDVQDSYRRSRRDLFVSTFSEEEFQRKVRAKRALLQAKEQHAHDD
jgi:hypothetical protein